MKKVRILIVVALCILLMGCSDKKEADSTGKCIISVECSTIFDNIENLDESVKEFVPDSGIILEEKTVDIAEGDSVYDVLSKTLKEENILMEASFTGNSAYIEGIDNIYEYSCGELSGWVFSVNGEFVGTSCSDYKVKNNDVIEWHYTCDLGEDVKSQK